MCQLCSTAWEVCPSCHGAGLQDGMNGPVMCYTCKGDSMVRIRDERGRFATQSSEQCVAVSDAVESQCPCPKPRLDLLTGACKCGHQLDQHRFPPAPPGFVAMASTPECYGGSDRI